MKGKFFIGAAVGFVGGVAAVIWTLEEAGYSLSGVKQAMMERIVRKVLGDGYKIEACAVSDYNNWLRRTPRNAYGYSGKTYNWEDVNYINYADYADAPSKPAEDLSNERFEVVRIFDSEALYSFNKAKLLHAVMDSGLSEWHFYDLRGNDNDPGVPATVELFPLKVNYCGENYCGENYCGTICTKEPLTFLPSKPYMELKQGDFAHSSVYVSAESFATPYNDCEEDEEGDDEE